MFYASHAGTRIQPTKLKGATCPGCGAPVVAKLGKIKQHHWAHAPGTVCSFEREAMTAWHWGWQQRFPEEWREVIDGHHRADVKTPHWTIEFQHSSISLEALESREEHWGENLIWVLNAEGIGKRIEISRKYIESNSSTTSIYIDRKGLVISNSTRRLAVHDPKQKLVFLPLALNRGSSRSWDAKVMTEEEFIAIVQEPKSMAWPLYKAGEEPQMEWLGVKFPTYPPFGHEFMFAANRFRFVDCHTVQCISVEHRWGFWELGGFYGPRHRVYQDGLLQWQFKQQAQIRREFDRLQGDERLERLAQMEEAGQEIPVSSKTRSELQKYVAKRRVDPRTPSQAALPLG